MAGLNDLRGFYQAKQFSSSVILNLLEETSEARKDIVIHV